MHIVSQDNLTIVNVEHVRYFTIDKNALIAKLAENDSVVLFNDADDEILKKMFAQLKHELKIKDDWIEINDLNNKIRGVNQTPGYIAG